MSQSCSVPRASILGMPLLAFLLFLNSVGTVEAGADWKAQWEQTLQAAKKEGRVTIYGSRRYDRVFSQFQKKYPEIKVSLFLGSGGSLVQRIMSERRAGKFLADVFAGGANTGYNGFYKRGLLAPIKPTLVLPEILDQSKWYKGKHRYMDDQGEYLFGFVEMVLPFVGYNPKLVDPKPFKSYWDLLDPKWKGKMIALDPTMGSAVDTHLVFLYHNPELGPEFLRRLLSEMDLKASRDTRQIVDWLAAGRYSISIFTTPSRARLEEAKNQGLSVDWFGPRHFKEGVGSSSSLGNLGLIKEAPHPNAARVAINWLLSREGQMALQRFTRADSRRIDIPKDGVRPSTRRLEGTKPVETDSPEKRRMKPILKLVKESWNKKK